MSQTTLGALSDLFSKQMTARLIIINIEVTVILHYFSKSSTVVENNRYQIITPLHVLFIVYSLITRYILLDGVRRAALPNIGCYLVQKLDCSI